MLQLFDISYHTPGNQRARYIWIHWRFLGCDWRWCEWSIRQGLKGSEDYLGQQHHTVIVGRYLSECGWKQLMRRQWLEWLIQSVFSSLLLGTRYTETMYHMHLPSICTWELRKSGTLWASSGIDTLVRVGSLAFGWILENPVVREERKISCCHDTPQSTLKVHQQMTIYPPKP